MIKHRPRAPQALAIGLIILFGVMATERGWAGDSGVLALRAARLWDGEAETLIMPGIVVVANGRITNIGELPPDFDPSRILDLGDVTLMPGLIDAHTHLLLQGDPTMASYAEQILKESIPYRTLRAAAAARKALEHGYTTLRDLGTEGAMYADVDLKKAFARGVLPGPRLFVATRALSTTGTYPLLGYAWELSLPTGVQVIDGPDEARKAVREEIARGADWIKFYSDRNYYIAKDGRIHSWRNFTDEELTALVREAHLRGRKVAAHAIGCTLPEPFLQVAFLALPVIPHLKMTDRGLFDVDRFDFVP